ncbi:superinfection immunity protein [Alteromonas sp. 5E99-2]|uniref:superinfection immunity protein n=1 Tax=Alteromonas sp. 5E99-2 TaxID=2817683 RepID=UPI001A99920C|nr:superinfection immunity protein [Alteromonas sp. 5E99-2]MBO1254742.1 superinfection immunity protein [Alteromonas sp. 5E99-2]
MEKLTNFYETTPLWMFSIGIIALLFVWFLPVLLAAFFNRKHLKLIAMACIPAVFSVIAWTGILVWSVTGKVWNKKEQPTAQP